jgi:photosystem II stability/assembly factor-like uncharacterized protein
MRTALLAAIGVLLSQGCENVTSVPNPPATSAPPGWTVLAAGTANLNAVNGLSDTAVWAVGDQGTILYWNGATLTPETSGTTANLRSVWAVDANHVYAAGDSGTILLRTGGAWTQVGIGTTREIFNGVWADTQRVVAVGSFGTIVVGTVPVVPGTMGTYKVIANADAENLMGVTGTPGGTAVAVGALGLVLTLTPGQNLGRTPIMGFSKLLTGVATAPGVSYLVGEQGSVYLSNAAGINLVAGFPTSSLRAVSITGTDAWMVGIDGTICEVSTGTTTCFPYSDQRWFTGVYAASPTAIWVVGATGTLLHGLPTQSAPVGTLSDAGGGG